MLIALSSCATAPRIWQAKFVVRVSSTNVLGLLAGRFAHNLSVQETGRHVLKTQCTPGGEDNHGPTLR